MKAATSRDVGRLIGQTADVEAAVTSGSVDREKVQGQWLYFMPGESVDHALDAAQAAVELSLHEWLVNPGRFLFGLAVRESPAVELGKPALTLLVHELCSRGRLGGIGLLTRTRQPYVGFHLVDDEVEIQGQVAALRETLSERGRVHWRDLPEPSRDVSRKAWRMTIVDHGEWLGLGWRPERGVLNAW